MTRHIKRHGYKKKHVVNDYMHKDNVLYLMVTYMVYLQMVCLQLVCLHVVCLHTVYLHTVRPIQYLISSSHEGDHSPFHEMSIIN